MENWTTARMSVATVLLYMAAPALGETPSERLFATALANTPFGNATMVWKDKASWDRASIMLFQRGGPAEAVAPLSNCTVSNGNRLGLTELGETGASVVVLNGPASGCRGYVAGMFMSNYQRPQ